MSLTQSEKNLPKRADDFFAPATVETLFWHPRFLSDTPLMLHVPFLFWIVGALHPRQIATCGLGSGVAHFAFCQGLDKQNIIGRCQGMGVWGTDSAAGGKPLAPKALSAHSEQFYRDVSVLTHASDSYAMLKSLRERSLDILLIDLCELQGAEQPSYEEWLGRLKPEGVLLVHGTETLAEQPSSLSRLDAFLKGRTRLEFRAGAGLAVVPLGDSHPPRLEALLKACPNGDVPGEVDLFFRRLGEGLEAVAGNAALKPQLSKGRAALKAAEAKIAEIEAEIETLQQAYEDRSRKAAVSQSEAFEYQTKLEELKASEQAQRAEWEKQQLDLRAEQQKAIAELTQNCEAAETAMASLRSEAEAATKALTADLTAAQAERAAIEQQLEAAEAERAAAEQQLEAAEAERAAAEQQLEAAQAERAAIEQQLETEQRIRFEETSTLTQKLEAADAQQAALHARIEALQATAQTASETEEVLMQAKAACLKAELALEAETRTRFEETSALTRMLEEAAGGKEALAKSKAETQALRQQLEALKGELSEAQGIIAGLYESTSWRVTAPMRRVKLMLSKD